MVKSAHSRRAQIHDLLKGQWIDNTTQQTLTFIPPASPDGYGEWIIEILGEHPYFREVKYSVDIEGEGNNEIVHLTTNFGLPNRGSKDRIFIDEHKLAIEHLTGRGYQLTEYFRPAGI
jgi:hypothetical protein